MKGIKWAKQWMAGGLVLVVLLMPVFLYSWAPLMNNWRLARFAQQLDTLPAVAGVTVLEKQTVCGKLNGSGNSMDFLACVLVETQLPPEALQAAYKDREFLPVRGHSQDAVAFLVVPMQRPVLETAYLQHHSITFRALEQVVDFDGYYALVLYDGGYSAGFDVRGH